MIPGPAAMLIGLILGGWVVYCVMSGDRQIARSKPRYYFRCTLRESECLPATISGEVVAATEAEAWDWVRQSIVMPGEWFVEMWPGRPHFRVYIADLDDGKMIVGQRLERHLSIEH
jgi:hypothetical protein